ncbi:hypothetical protein KY342_01855 [Candidatus Woesearchaeota archaeon]|nr:hypothetical protein [Candidatus Woesearchaeota archaeon]
MPKSDLEIKKEFEELYKTKDLKIAWDILDEHFERKTKYSTLAQDLITTINSMVDSQNTEKCAEILEAIITVPRKRDPRNPQIYRWSADAVYSLRTLAENPLLDYNQTKIETLANEFNEKFSDKEYSIGRFSYTSPKTKEIVYINPRQKRVA